MTYEEFKETFTSKLSASLGGQINLDNTSFIGQISDLICSNDFDLHNRIHAVVNQLDISRAQGSHLDIIGKIFNAHRVLLTPTVIDNVRINKKNDDFTLPQGSIVRIENIHHDFRTTEAIEVNGEKNIKIIAVEFGFLSIDVPDYRNHTASFENDTIEESVSIDISESHLTFGSNQEPDDHFRNRLLKMYSTTGSSTKGGILSALVKNAKEWVENILIYEFGLKYGIIPEDKLTNRNPGIFEVVVKPSAKYLENQAQANQTIATFIQQKRPIGSICDSIAVNAGNNAYARDPSQVTEVEVTVEQHDTFDQENIKFSLAEAVRVNVALKIRINQIAKTNEDIYLVCKNTIDHYIQTKDIAQSLYYSELYGILSNRINLSGVIIDELKWGARKETLHTNTIFGIKAEATEGDDIIGSCGYPISFVEIENVTQTRE